MGRKARLHPGDGLCVSFFTQEGAEAARSGRGTQSEDQARVCQDRNHRGRLAYVPTYSWGNAGGHGRASAHDSRLPASQPHQCDEPVSTGNLEEQAPGSGQTRRRASAHGIAVAKQTFPHPIILHNGPSLRLSAFSAPAGKRLCFGWWSALDPYWTQILGRGSRKLLKDMVGTRRLELLTSTVSR